MNGSIERKSDSMKVKIIVVEDYWGNDFEKKVNEFLEKNKNEIIDIKYSVTGWGKSAQFKGTGATMGCRVLHCAMIIMK
jgi:hypothetical protein